MEVTCERCKAEYDFDDSLVGASGTTVKCTDCGHVFKLLPSASTVNRGNLQIRFRDGRVEQLSSLRELQRRARDGEISLHDEIGRDGSDFRPLHLVAELRGFFQASEPVAAKPATADSPPAEAAKRTMHGVGPGFGGQPTHPHPVAPQAYQAPRAPVAAGFQAQPSAAPASAVPSARPPASSARAPAATPAPAPRPAPAPHAAAYRGLSGPPEPSPSTQAPPASRLYLDEDDAAEVPATRRMAGGGSMRWIGLGVLVAGGAWFAVNAMNASRRSGEEPLAAPMAQPAPDASAPSTDAAAGDAAAKPDASAQNPRTTGQPPAAAKDTAPEAAPGEKLNPKQAPEKPQRTKHKTAEPVAEAKSQREPHSRRDSKPADVPAEADYQQLIGQADRLLDHNDFRKAQAAYEQALEKRSGGSEANSGLGFALLGQGRPGKAIPYLEKAARNGFAVASIGLGDANAKLGHETKAVEAYKEYLRRLPGGSKAAYAKARIAALQRSTERAEPPRVPSAPAVPEGEEEPLPDDGEEYVPAGTMEQTSP